MIVPVLLPWLNAWPMTRDALQDVRAQELTPGDALQVILIGNGVSPTDDALAKLQAPDRVTVWNLPFQFGLAEVWNRGLDAAWALGAEEAWVVNNDTRFWRRTLQTLRDIRKATDALFVSGVGVTEAQFQAFTAAPVVDTASRGGPDFSCFLLTKEAHQLVRFDERIYPAYTEDLDAHRRYLLAGQGARIFGTNVPFHHLDRGSGSLKAMDEARRQRVQEQLHAVHAYYAQKWGGPVNQETFVVPFGPATHPGVTTPELQHLGWPR